MRVSCRLNDRGWLARSDGDESPPSGSGKVIDPRALSSPLLACTLVPLLSMRLMQWRQALARLALWTVLRRWCVMQIDARLD